MRHASWILLALLLAAALAASAPAEEEDGFGDAWGDSLAAAPDSLGVPPDSLGGPPPDEPLPVTVSQGVHPRFRSDTRSTDRRIDVNTTLNLGIAFPRNWSLSSDIFYKRGIPRGLNRESTEGGFSISTSKRLAGRFPLTLSASRNRFRQDQNKGTDNYRVDTRDRTSVSASTNAGWQPLEWVGVNGMLTAGSQTVETKNNQGLNQSTEDGNRSFAGRVDFLPMENLKMEAGYSGARTSSAAQLLLLTDQLQTTRDSVQVKMDYRRGQDLVLSLSGGELEQTSELLDFARDAFSVVLPESIPVVEKTTQRNWGGRMSLDWQPWSLLRLNLNFSALTGEKRSSTSITKDRDEESQDFSAKVTVKPWSSMSTEVSYKESYSHSDEYTSDKKSFRREALLRSTQRLGQTFQIIADMSLLLNQDYYADKLNNPLDRDQIKDRYSLTVGGVVCSWLKASNTLSYFRSRDISIDSSKSISNKDKTTLNWSAKLEYGFFKRFFLKQRLEVQAAKDDFVFTQEQNSLDRESTLQTSTSFPIYRKIQLDFAHEFKLRQMGSFLPDPDAAGHPETFFLSKRVKKEKLNLGFSYAIFRYLSISVREELGREVTYYYSDGSQDLTPYGNLNMAVVYNREWGQAGKVRAELVHRARSGRFVRENQRSVWIPTLSIEYNF